MRIFKYLSDDITDESIYPIIEAINDATPQTKITIGITSQGGISYTGRFLLNILNDPSNVKRITLVCIDKCYSAAFDIFYKFKGEKQIMLGSRGMLHYDSTFLKHTRKDKLKKDGENFTTHDQLELLGAETINMSKQFLTQEELDVLEDSDDIYFTFERMLEIFPDAKVV